MGTEEKTDYRKSTPEVLYQMRKTVIALFKKEKSVEEIIEVTDFSERTVRETIRKYKSGGMAALKPKKRGRMISKGTIINSCLVKAIITPFIGLPKAEKKLTLSIGTLTMMTIKSHVLKKEEA